MRICFVGKYPPIQGGVSASTYWAVRGLAERGHQIYVVTNASEVEARYRLHLEDADIERLEASFSGGGLVKVFQPEHGTTRIFHIPLSNPFVSKLAGLATKVVREFDCEVVVGSYFEPYGVAAGMAAGWTSLPLVLEHAGSDLDRLMRLPELATVYKETLRGADAVVTGRRLFDRFIGMGVSEMALHNGPPHALPPHFNPAVTPLSVEDVERLARRRSPGPRFTFDPELPTIGMYGKPGTFKGTFDLLAALRAIKVEGARFNLLLMCGDAAAPEISDAVNDAGLGERTWLLPFLPHWRVPAFIRRCTAVGFLERDFPIAIHGPLVPCEVLACGTCLILSGEIHNKQRHRDKLVDGDSILLVPDPKNHEVLAKQLRRVIEQPAAARQIGARGGRVAADFPSLAQRVESWESIVNAAARPGLDTVPDSTSLAERLATVIFWAKPLLKERFDSIIEEFLAFENEPTITSLADVALGREFCQFLNVKGEAPISDVARYHEARLWSLCDDAPPVPPIQRSLDLNSAICDQIRDRYPRRCVQVRIEAFDYDVRGIFSKNLGIAIEDAAELQPDTQKVCFVRLGNLSPTELSLNEATNALIASCEGGEPAWKIADKLSRDYARGCEAEKVFHDQVFDAMGRLYDLGLLSFADSPTVPVPMWPHP